MIKFIVRNSIIVMKLLVLIDFSESSINALHYAVALYKDLPVSFDLMHVFQGRSSHLMGEGYNEKWLYQNAEDAEAELQFLINEVAHSCHPESTFQSLFQEGNLVDMITEVIIERKADLVVLGTKKSSELRNFFWGNHSVKVIRNVYRCPVLAVPQNFTFKTLKKILFSTNYKREFKIEEFKTLIQLIALRKPEIIIGKLSEDQFMTDKQKEHKEALQLIFKNADHKTEKINWDTSEIITINRAALEKGCDMICLINHHMNFLENLLEEHVVVNACIYSDLPVLILPGLNH